MAVGRLAALTAILLLGWALRVHALDARSLWADEGWTLVLSQGPRLQDVVRTLADDQHPPLFFVLFRIWRVLTGDSEFATRFLSVLISMIGVAAIYPLGRLLFAARAGVLAALILTLADLHIDLAQEVRHYSLLTTLAIVSSLYYARWRRERGRASQVGYVVSALGMLYTHYLGVFVLAVHAGHMALTLRPLRRMISGLPLLVAVGVGFLPWLPVVVAQNRVRWDNPVYYQNALPNSMATFQALRTALLGHHYVLLAGLLLLGLVAVRYTRDGATAGLRPRVRLQPLAPTLLVALWIGLVVAVTVLVNARREFLTVRNFVIVLPPLALLIGRGLSNLERSARWFFTAMLVVIALTTVDARRHYPDWRAVTAHVTANHLPGEPVLMDIWVGDFAVRYYVARQMGGAAEAISLREWRDRHGPEFLAQLQRAVEALPAFWLVSWGEATPEDYHHVIAEAGFERTAALTVDHLGTPLYSSRYDRLDPDVIAQFGSVIALQRMVAADTAAPGQPLAVSLWWSALRPPPLDYSVSVFLLDAAGNLVAQHDGPPQAGNPPTTAWQPGEAYFDRHSLDLPPGLAPGTYQLGLRVYWYGDQQPLPVLVEGHAVSDALILGTLALRS